MKKDVTALLAILRGENERGTGTQKLSAPEETPRRVPTLDGAGRPVTPMLRARFAFAGRWKNALQAQTWLSAADMGRVAKTRAWRTEVELRRENWPQSSVSKLPVARLSLFAVDTDDGDATYLVWGTGDEPKVIEFSGGSETVHRDFQAYLQHHVGLVATLRGSTAPKDEGDGLAAYLASDRRRLDLWIKGLERWGQPVLVHASVATAKLVLPLLPESSHKTAEALLATAGGWADDPRGEAPLSLGYAITGARPISPKVEGKQVWESMHACCEAALSATGYHAERTSVVYADRVKTALLGMRKQSPADIAEALNAANLRTPSGSLWKPETAKSALERLERTLEHSRDAAAATVAHALLALGKGGEAKIRAAIRAAIRA